MPFEPLKSQEDIDREDRRMNVIAAVVLVWLGAGMASAVWWLV